MKKTIFTLTSLAFFGLSTLQAQVKVGNNPTSIDASAELEVESSAKGFLPPRMTTAQRNAISNPAEGLTIYNTDANCLQWWNGNGWFDICSGPDGGLIGSLIADSNSACDGEPEFFFFKGLEYKPVESDGKCWLDRNLGATRVAQTSDDFEAYGSLYQWGRGSDGHELIDWTSSNSGTPVNGTTATLSSTDSPGNNRFITRNSSPFDWRSPQNNNLWQGINGINNPCPSGYRVPTEAEWDAEVLSWGSNNNNATGAFHSPLKLPMAGMRYRDQGSLLSVGFNGFYWSASTFSVDAAENLFFESGVATSKDRHDRAFGLSVRCLKD